MRKVYIIAEAGVNHNGDINIARQLIDVAAESGADAVKFQTFKAENIVSVNAPKAEYQKKTTEKEESQFQMLRKLELDLKSHQVLIDYCKSKKITFLSTPFDFDSIELLNNLGLETFKIPSGEITNLPYLKRIGELNKKVILSTGMANIKEIGDALKILTDAGTLKNNITVLHANTEYPTPFEDVNLLAMNTIAKEFNVKVGYSDHTLGIEVPVAAVALGAVIIEKHFTISREMKGPDHKASLEPNELKAMVLAIRNIELSIGGSGKKEPSDSEKRNIEIARKSIHLSRDLIKGSVITENDLIPLRNGDGISPMDWYKVLGKVLKENKSAFCKLNWNDLI